MANLQPLFQEPIIRQIALSPGYEDHASDVWLVQTSREEVVVRASRMAGVPDQDFWYGCNRMFGVDPARVHELERINNALHRWSTIAVPRVIRKGVIDEREFVVVEKLEGEVCSTFKNQPDGVLRSLGRGIASIHRYRADYVGNCSASTRMPLIDFHDRLIVVMQELTNRFYADNDKIMKALPRMIAMLQEAPVPQYATFVLVDMDPSQFLANRNDITGLVDTEVYVVAPRELDFIGLEYVLDRSSAVPFAKAYEAIAPIPRLARYRQPYRFFYRLLRVQGGVDLDAWLNHPTCFDE